MVADPYVTFINMYINADLAPGACWNDPAAAPSVKWCERNVESCVHCNNTNVFSTGQGRVVICALSLPIQNINSLLSADTGRTVMYTFCIIIYTPRLAH